MSILQEIDELKTTIANGLAAVEGKTAAGVEDVRKEAAAALETMQRQADRLREDIAAGAARTWTLRTAKGQEVEISERDGLQLFAAVPICLARKTAVVRLGGQEVELMWTDLEQLAAQLAPPRS
jgi:hypothetical protein